MTTRQVYLPTIFFEKKKKQNKKTETILRISLSFITNNQNSSDLSKKSFVAHVLFPPSPFHKGDSGWPLGVRENFFRICILKHGGILLWDPLAVSSRKYTAKMDGIITDSGKFIFLV